MRKYFHILLLTGALIFSIQLSVAPLVHNHPFDLKHHYDCPAYILSTTLVSFFVTVLFGFGLTIPFLRRLPKQKSYQHRFTSKFFNIYNKAPPTYFI